MSKSKKIFMIASFLISGAGGLLHECVNNEIKAICWNSKYYRGYNCEALPNNGGQICVKNGNIGPICKPV